MVIRDDTNNNQKLFSPLAGPYDEDSRLALTCEVEPGDPAPGHVSWWQLESVMQINEAAATGGRPHNGQHWWQQQPLDKADYITTVSFDGEPEDGAVNPYANQLIAVHNSSPPQFDQISLPPLLADAKSQRRLMKHWRRFQNQTSPSPSDDKLQTTLEISSLGRSSLGAEFLCLANNNNFSAPLNTTVRLNLNREYLFRFDFGQRHRGFSNKHD